MAHATNAAPLSYVECVTEMHYTPNKTSARRTSRKAGSSNKQETGYRLSIPCFNGATAEIFAKNAQHAKCGWALGLKHLESEKVLQEAAGKPFVHKWNRYLVWLVALDEAKRSSRLALPLSADPYEYPNDLADADEQHMEGLQERFKEATGPSRCDTTSQDVAAKPPVPEASSPPSSSCTAPSVSAAASAAATIRQLKEQLANKDRLLEHKELENQELERQLQVLEAENTGLQRYANAQRRLRVLAEQAYHALHAEHLAEQQPQHTPSAEEHTDSEEQLTHAAEQQESN